MYPSRIIFLSWGLKIRWIIVKEIYAEMPTLIVSNNEMNIASQRAITEYHTVLSYYWKEDMQTLASLSLLRDPNCKKEVNFCFALSPPHNTLKSFFCLDILKWENKLWEWNLDQWLIPMNWEQKIFKSKRDLKVLSFCAGRERAGKILGKSNLDDWLIIIIIK